MKDLFLVCVIFSFLALGCGGGPSGPKAEWLKSKKVAGKDQGLSHVSGIVVDDKTVFVAIGGTVADEKEGTNGLRRIALDTGAVTSVDDGERMPQSETGGIVGDDKYVYWNGGGNILRAAKDAGNPEVVTSENVGVGIDMAVDGDKVYWTNHGYYSPNAPSVPRPIYVVPNQGGKPQVFVDAQDRPGNITIDDKFVYWNTGTALVKRAKSDGEPQIIYQANAEKEGIDVLEQDADNLYFGFRGAGESRWAMRKISKNGGEPQTLLKTFSLKPFMVDDQNIYFFDEDGLTADVLCRVSKNGGEPVMLDSGYSSGVIAQTKTKVFFGSLDTLYSVDK